MPQKEEKLNPADFEWAALTELEQLVVQALYGENNALTPYGLYLKSLDIFFNGLGIETDLQLSALAGNLDCDLEDAENELYKKSGGLTNAPVYRTIRRVAEGLDGWVVNRKTSGKADKVFYLALEVRKKMEVRNNALLASAKPIKN